MSTTVAVSGAGGLIGRATVAALQCRGAAVAGLVGPLGGRMLPAPQGPGRWSWGSVEDTQTVEDLLNGSDCVIHLAGPPSVGQSFRTPAAYICTHAAGAATLLQTAARLGTVRRVVLVSSAEVYGLPRQELVGEDHPVDPLSPYAVAKLGAENISRVIAATYGIELVIVRPFAVYGPESPPWSLVGTAVTQAIEGHGDEPALMSDLTRVRDLIYVTDVADLLVCAAEMRLPPAGLLVLNAATGRPTSVLDLALAALRGAGRAAPVRQRAPLPDPSPRDVMAGMRPLWSDPVRLVGDPSRAAERLGWSARVDVPTGLAAVIARRRREAAGPR